MNRILALIEQNVVPGTVIPKPEANKAFFVKGWGCRRGERALIYTIPNHRNPSQPYQKGITESEWVEAFNQLTKTGEFTREWFCKTMVQCHSEGSCNFTTIGGIFELLAVARYTSRGLYRQS